MQRVLERNNNLNALEELCKFFLPFYKQGRVLSLKNYIKMN